MTTTSTQNPTAKHLECAREINKLYVRNIDGASFPRLDEVSAEVARHFPATEAEGRKAKKQEMDALLDWLSEKITKAEQAVRFRMDSASTWKEGTNAEWDAAGAIYPSTMRRKYSKRERLVIADADDRIAAKLRRELEMFKACAAAVSQRAALSAQTNQPPEK